ncbi:YdcF family protein [Desulfobacca acetoxidans]|uniref:DUF218 domain-containing protein n=1 Tax=Desulfobacca acetoxidans (strain ATCC 700848 / DSM 11109 / ASRB2) TaxID=880072 RepID=F2NCF2_DESAR|nr:YdcF family protein [Desulfobacca acetoxidans]AEB09016.1 protein of unknown function DUF218 [Desulfobacca acetoxidans DSM 11109]
MKIKDLSNLSTPESKSHTLDAIIIVGALVGRDGHPGRVARFRLHHALPLVVETYPESWVVITGGLWPGRPATEARAMADWALGQAVRHWGEACGRKLEQRLILEEVSLSTVESARHTAVLLQQRGLMAAGLVTDELHMPRAAYLFRRSFRARRLTIRLLPARGLLVDYWQRRRYVRLTKFILREGGAWMKLWGRGILGHEQL